MRRFFASIMASLFALLLVLPATADAATKKVYEIRIDNFDEAIQAMHAQVTRRVFEQAASDPNTAAVVIVLNTPGGYLDAAYDICDIIMHSDVPSIAYVDKRAISAGALIGTAAEKLYMAPGSSIGAAEPRNAATNETDPKTISVVASEFESTAKVRGRNTELARAMVDKSVTGSLLTLTFADAVEQGYANGEAASLDEAIRMAGITDYELVPFSMTTSESVGRFLTIPWVAILLLVLGVIAIGIEFVKPGLTLPGLIGIVALSLFFIGNVLVGTAGWLELGLALIGVLLLVVEAFVPGFGIFGLAGVISVASSIFLAVPDQDLALLYLLFASIAFAISLFMIVRAVTKRGLGKALTLETGAKGWQAGRVDQTRLIGLEGRTLTVLRPAGTAWVGNEKVDVVADGEFVGVDVAIQVVSVDGTRVVVRPVK